jgi:CubicO group peptidase (beta-lactamase class C family)
MDTFWEISSPAEQQMDPAVLEDLRAKVRDMPNVYSLLIVRNGKIVHEQYHNAATMNSLLPARSITKRVTALMVGIGIEDGYIQGYPELITSYFPEIASAGGEGWDQVNIYHLLHMISGMDWDEEDDLADYEKHLNQPLPYIFDRDIVHEPESYFAYNTPSIDLLSYVVERAYGEKLATLTEEKIFDPLGILGYEWESIDTDVKRGGTGLELTARDLAKIGLLHARYGNWQSEGIVKAEWINLCFDDALLLDGIDGNHAAGLSIGNTWWTKEYSGVKTHYADGYGGQMLMIIPEHDIIIVMNRRYNVSANENTEAFDEFFNVVLPDVLESVLD